MNCCLQAGKYCFPYSIEKKTVSQLPLWKETIKPLRDSSLLWHHIWVDCGKPKKGTVYDIMRNVRSKYHQGRCIIQRPWYHSAVRNVIINEFNVKRLQIAESFEQKTASFWHEIKKINNKNLRSAPIVMDHAVGDVNICDLFAEKYEKLYCSVECTDSEKREIDKMLKDKLHSGKENVIISPNDVSTAVLKLNADKKDGSLGVFSNHFKHAPNQLCVLLSSMFTSMLAHGCTPDVMLHSTVISIPKDNRASLQDSSNYRGITLSSSLCKILDHILLQKYHKALQSSGMQYGFKSEHSTAICTAVVKEVISYYIHNGSHVYACLLDASKAFDRLHFGTLFSLLFKHNLPAPVKRLLFDSYVNQNVYISWNNQVSKKIRPTNGVKQGGVLSPILFNPTLMNY